MNYFPYFSINLLSVCGNSYILEYPYIVSFFLSIRKYKFYDNFFMREFRNMTIE